MRYKSKNSRLLDSILKIRYLLILILTLIILIILRNAITKIILVGLLITMGCISTYWKRFTRLSLGIELISFISIIFTVSFGLKIGITAGILMLLIANLLNERLHPPAFVPILGIVPISVIAAMAGKQNIIYLGIALNLLYNLIIHFFYTAVMRYNPISSAISFIINFALNLYLFTTVAPFLLEAL